MKDERLRKKKKNGKREGKLKFFIPTTLLSKRKMATFS